MNAEIPSRQEAWALIKQKHDKLAYEEFTIYLRTGNLNLETADSPQPIYVLLNQGKRSLIFDSGQRTITQSGKIKTTFTPHENKFMQILLPQPHIAQTFGMLYPHFYPEDTQKRSNKEIAEIMRPLVSRLRIKLAEANESLPQIISSIRGTGYVYIPHSTLRE